MNDDCFDDLEKRLRQLSPAPLPQLLAARLAHAPGDEPLTIGDRILATFALSGAIAACLILGLIVWQLSLSQPAQSNNMNLAARQRLAAEYQALELASR